MRVNRRGITLMSSAHVVNDVYQGAVPALLPFLVAQRHYTYAAVSGLTLAATVLSSVAQPASGWWTDRSPRRWLIPVGTVTAALGVALAGLMSSYVLTWLVIALSVLGLHGTPVLLVPALVMAALLLARLGQVLDGRDGSRRPPALQEGDDDWPSFIRLTVVVVMRSVVFFGLTSFVALYFIRNLGVSTGVGGVVLSLFLVAGAAGTLLGGWVADRDGRLTSIRIGFGLSVPAIAGLVLAPGPAIAVVCVAVAGVALYMPFSVFVVLGQDYLPHRIGTASGVTVGLAVSVGGLFSPLLGWLADRTDLRVALMVLVAVPAVALLLTRGLGEPRPAS